MQIGLKVTKIKTMKKPNKKQQMCAWNISMNQKHQYHKRGNVSTFLKILLQIVSPNLG